MVIPVRTVISDSLNGDMLREDYEEFLLIG